jgi:hypothetical protein
MRFIESAATGTTQAVDIAAARTGRLRLLRAGVIIGVGVGDVVAPLLATGISCR